MMIGIEIAINKQVAWGVIGLREGKHHNNNKYVKKCTTCSRHSHGCQN